MKSEERRQEIIEILIKERSASLDDLAQRFGVSKMTIHRDLDELEFEGLLRKQQGGATINPAVSLKVTFVSDCAKRHMKSAALRGVPLSLSNPV